MRGPHRGVNARSANSARGSRRIVTRGEHVGQSPERPHRPRPGDRFARARGGHPYAMSEGVTYEQAAAILGCHFSNVAKLIRKGDLTSTGKRGSLTEPGGGRGPRRTPRCRASGQSRPVPPQVRACGPSAGSRPRVAVAATGRRTTRRHAASGSGSYPSRQASQRPERWALLGPTRSPGDGGGGAAGAEDAAPLVKLRPRHRVRCAAHLGIARRTSEGGCALRDPARDRWLVPKVGGC